MTSHAKQAPAKAFTSSLSLIATSYAYRCDAKFADESVRATLAKIERAGSFVLGDYLPLPLVKGIQPEYLDQPTDDSIPVVNTLAIQNLSINESDCRHITREDFDSLDDERKLRKGDVLLTVDGGVSIGKPCHFDIGSPHTMDSHVVVLRPKRLSSLALVYLLASNLGQMQFRRAESGASGQTTVTEDDIRRFIFPKALLSKIDAIASHIESERKRIAKARQKLLTEEAKLWTSLDGVTK
jgi:hypothetical protein